VLPFPRGSATTFSIGRDRGCDLAVDDLSVSRVHARLERTRDGWVLTDLGSTNGTRVNGWLVRDRVNVRPGDLVRFGETEYLLAAGTGAAGTGEDERACPAPGTQA
jgi:pSer/pThr/pTyr-binding forkhead associated (FHA) protein